MSTRERIEQLFSDDIDEKARLIRALELSDALETKQSAEEKALIQAINAVSDQRVRDIMTDQLDAIRDKNTMEMPEVIDELKALGFQLNDMIKNGIRKVLNSKLHQQKVKLESE